MRSLTVAVLVLSSMFLVAHPVPGGAGDAPANAKNDERDAYAKIVDVVDLNKADKDRASQGTLDKSGECLTALYTKANDTPKRIGRFTGILRRPSSCKERRRRRSRIGGRGLTARRQSVAGARASSRIFETTGTQR